MFWTLTGNGVYPRLNLKALPLLEATGVGVARGEDAPRMAQQNSREEDLGAARVAEIERQLAELESRNRKLTEALERRDEEAETEKKTRRWPCEC